MDIWDGRLTLWRDSTRHPRISDRGRILWHIWSLCRDVLKKTDQTIRCLVIYGIILHKLLCLKWELPTNKFTEDFSIWANLIVSHMIWFVIMLIHLMLLFANPSTVLENVLFLRTMLSFSPFIIPHTSLSLAYVKCGIIFYIVLWSKSLLLLFTCMFYHLLHVFYQFLSMACNILYYVWIFILK